MSSTPILDEMMNCVRDAEEVGLKVTAFFFGVGGCLTLWKETVQYAHDHSLPEPDVYQINEGEPCKLCDYGGYPCWYLPPPLVEERYTEKGIQFDITPSLLSPPEISDQIH